MNYRLKLGDMKHFIHGLPWLDETWPMLLRVPMRVAKPLGRSIVGLSKNTSGARIRFQTRAKTVKFTAWLSRPDHYNNFSNLGQRGIDVYVNGKYNGTFFNERKLVQIVKLDACSPRSDDGMNVVQLYLPLYNGIKNLQLEADQPLEPVSLMNYTDSKPIMYYGSSITQGGCASRPGMSYAAQVERATNLDFVNLGFSGNGLGQLALAELMATVDARAFVLDYGANLLHKGIDVFKSRYDRFYRVIRDARPDTPIIMVNLQGFLPERTEPGGGEYVELFRKHVRDVYENAHGGGDENVFILEANEIIGLDGGLSMVDLSGTTDGTHPNDLGFFMYARKFVEFFKKIGLA
ncbi:MAG: SGNH/GDSL hydrolase family protein [Promethearchaeota archaeon]